jgi:uncharacterized protein (TIGR00369 family)
MRPSGLQAGARKSSAGNFESAPNRRAVQSDPTPRPDQIPQEALSPWQEPVRGGYPEPGIFTRPPSDLLREMIAGTAPQPPISRLTGMRLIECGVGTAAFSMPLSDWLCTSQGAISIGPTTIPADAAMACAIQTELPSGTPLSTAELSLRLLRPAPAGDSITARGRVVDVRRTIALAEVTVTDRHQQLIAHGSSLCVLAPEAERAGARPTEEPSAIPDADPGPPAADAAISTSADAAIGTPADAAIGTPADAAIGTPADAAIGTPAERGGPDPWERPAIGVVLAQDVWEQMTGLEVLRAQLAGELPEPPIHHLTGLRVTEAAERQATYAMPAGEWLCAPVRGRVQGGAVALLAEAGLSGAIQTTVPAATAVAPIDLKINYLRPLAADGAPATATGQVLHSGRRMAVATAQVIDSGGRPVAVATGSAMLLPGRAVALSPPRA